MTIEFRNELLVSLAPVMMFTEHLAVADVGCSAIAPGSHVVSIHLFKFPDFAFIGVVAECAVQGYE